MSVDQFTKCDKCGSVFGSEEAMKIHWANMDDDSHPGLVDDRIN